jgi:hypothetical protein
MGVEHEMEGSGEIIVFAEKLSLSKRGNFENVGEKSFYLAYLGPLGPLRYTQITTMNVVIKAPAIPDKTHSAVNTVGATARSQGHKVW